MKPFAYAAAQGFIRARLSRLLDLVTWGRLLSCATAGELTRALRDTHFASGLTAEGELNLPLLRAEAAAAAWTLIRYLPREAGRLLSWYTLRFEIENLKMVLRSLHYGLDSHVTARSMLPLQPRAGNPGWARLLETGSVDGLIGQLRGSPYAAPLERAAERYRLEQRVFHIEVSLDLGYFSRLVRMIQGLKGSEAAQATAVLGRWIAVQNLVWAYRYRLYGGMSPEEIINYTLHQAFGAGLHVVRRIALGAPISSEAQQLGLNISPDMAENEALTRIEFLAERERYVFAARAIHRPLFDLGGVLAYLILLDAELRDLAVIAEGKKLGLPNKELAPRLLRTV